MLVAITALVVAVGGTANAIPSAITSVLNKKDVKKVKKLASAEADKAITARAPSLSVANASDSTKVGGTALSGLLTTGGCQAGKVLAVAEVTGSVAMTTSYPSTSFLSTTRNCAGGTIEVRRESIGLYDIRFNGLTSGEHAALFSGGESGAGNGTASGTAVGAGGDAGGYQVKVRNQETGALADVNFTVVVF
jgi:hypothetical protein